MASPRSSNSSSKGTPASMVRLWRGGRRGSQRATSVELRSSELACLFLPPFLVGLRQPGRDRGDEREAGPFRPSRFHRYAHTKEVVPLIMAFQGMSRCGVAYLWGLGRGPAPGVSSCSARACAAASALTPSSRRSRPWPRREAGSRLQKVSTRWRSRGRWVQGQGERGECQFGVRGDWERGARRRHRGCDITPFGVIEDQIEAEGIVSGCGSVSRTLAVARGAVGVVACLYSSHSRRLGVSCTP